MGKDNKSSIEAELAFAPIKPGLLIIASQDAEVHFHSRWYMERGAATGSKQVCGRSFDQPRRVISLREGTEREVEQLKNFQRSYLGSAQATVEIQHVGGRGFDYLGVEARKSLQGVLAGAKGSYVSFGAPSKTVLANLHVLAALKEVARVSGTGILVAVSGQAAGAAAELEEIADEYVEVERCEADPGALLAFTVKFTFAHWLDQLSAHRKAMVQVTRANESFRVFSSRFIAADVRSRVMARLHKKGIPNARIADFMDVDKATVGRRLAACVLPDIVDDNFEWLDSFAEALELDVSKLKLTAERRAAPPNKSHSDWLD